MILTENGVLKLMQRIKSFIASQLNTKASSVHTHSISEIENLSSQLGGGYTKSEIDTLLNDYIPKVGGRVFSGTDYSHIVNDSVLYISGGTNTSNGGVLELYGKEHTSYAGYVSLKAQDSSNSSQMVIQPSGTFIFFVNGTTKNIAMQEDVIPRSGGAVITGSSIFKTHNNTGLLLGGGTSDSDGGSINLVGNNGYFTGDVLISATKPNEDRCVYFFSNTVLYAYALTSPTLGSGAYKWGQIYSTVSTISTSDSRLKNSIKNIDDKLLDAWGNIEPKQYKFNDATEKKGEKARFHTGYLAQDIQTECEKHGVNASDYGLFCYDEWEEQEEVSEEIETEKDGKKVKEKRVIQPKREKGDMYALRYEEALVVECAYLRREINKLKEELNLLKTK